MKKLLFEILVILLTPIYLIIKVVKGAIKIITDITEPFADGISDFVDNMCGFWRKVFKIKEDQYGSRD